MVGSTIGGVANRRNEIANAFETFAFVCVRQDCLFRPLLLFL